jgi:hypothetical protein
MPRTQDLTSVRIPIELARAIDSVTEKLKDPELANRRHFIARAGALLAEVFNVEKIPSKKKGKTLAIKVKSEQYDLIRRATKAGAIPFMSQDEAYRFGVLLLLSGLAPTAGVTLPWPKLEIECPKVKLR